jgi:hypothetical protein
MIDAYNPSRYHAQLCTPCTLWSVLMRFCGPSSTPGCCLCTTAHTPPTFCGWCLHACRPQARTFPSRLISRTPTPTTVASRGATAYFFYCRGRSNRYSTVTTYFGPTVGYLAPGSHPVWLHRWYLKLISVVGAADAFTVVYIWWHSCPWTFWHGVACNDLQTSQ